MAAENPSVAVLLPTFNGARFVETQIRSLARNATPFTVHWLDDHSTDDTRETVRRCARDAGVQIKEWHHEQRQGIPGAFFELLKSAAADIYLFCDQDDIWQPGKIDATVTDLLPDLASPVLSFSDPLVFNEGMPEELRRLSEITSVKGPAALRKSSMFVICPAIGHTIGFTRPLREIFLRHEPIARKYAAGQDTWFYLIADAAGTCRLLRDVPTTLYRLHGNNAYGNFFRLVGWRSFVHAARRWRIQQALRRWVSRQAEGFCLASKTLPDGPQLERSLALARLMLTVDRRQSLQEIIRLVQRRALPPGRDFTLWFAATCLLSDARK